jgi:UDP-glucuronate decarboxylase
VEDWIEGFLRMLNKPDRFIGPVNLGNPNEFDILELAERIIRLAGSCSKIVFKPLPADDPPQRRPDIGLARRKLGWQPTIELEEGLRRTIDFFREFLKAPRLLQGLLFG